MPLFESWFVLRLGFRFWGLAEDDRRPLANLISVSLLDFLSCEELIFAPLFGPFDVIDVGVASLDNSEAQESSSGEANVRGDCVVAAEFPPLKMPEIACMKVFFPFTPLLLFPDELILLLFPTDMEEEEVPEKFEYLEGEFGIDISFSSGLANEGFCTGILGSCNDSFFSSVDNGIFDLFFLDLMADILPEESLALLLTGIPNFAGSVSGVAGSWTTLEL